MYKAYFDDSGTDSSCPLAIAACYVSTKRGWDNFSRQWDCVRNDEDFDIFHMADFAANPERGIQPFCDWSHEKRQRVYSRLAQIINENKWAGFGIAIPKYVFDQVIPDLPDPMRFKFGTYHFTFAVKVILTMIANWRKEYWIRTPMHYVFDRMGKGRGEIRSIWENLDGFDALGKLGMEPSGYSFEDKSLDKPLQAADILAWQLHDHMRRVVLVGKTDPGDSHRNFKMLRLDQHMNLAFMTENNFLHTVEWEIDSFEKRARERDQMVVASNGRNVGAGDDRTI